MLHHLTAYYNRFITAHRLRLALRIVVLLLVFWSLNKEHKPLKVKFTVSKNNAMELDAYVIYVLKEEDLGLEYVGAKFVETSNQDRRVLEKILIKHGKKV